MVKADIMKQTVPRAVWLEPSKGLERWGKEPGRASWGRDENQPARWRSRRGHERCWEAPKGKRDCSPLGSGLLVLGVPLTPVHVSSRPPRQGSFLPDLEG